MADISNAELGRRIDDGVATFRNEIKVVHRRLDDHARTLTDHAVKLAVAEVQTAPAVPVPKDDSKALTRWDLTVFVAGVYLLLEVIPKLRALFGK